MKVLHVLYSGLGGHGNVFFSMADADKEKQLEYEALFFGIEEVREGYIQKAVARKIPFYAVKKKPGFDPASYKKIKHIIRSSDPDIIFIHGSTFLFAVKNFFSFFSGKRKFIVRETQANHLKTKKEWFALGAALLLADKVVFLSNEFRDEVRKKLPMLFSEKRTAVVPNGLDLNIYKPEPRRDDRFITIGMQSRLIPIKDHSTLLKSFALCLKSYTGAKKLRLLIAGDGTCMKELQQQAHNLNIADSIVFTGMLEENELPAFINSLDVYVHATLGETMSTAVMQVMACRLPIIASDVPGINNMISDGVTGILVPARNEEKLADAVLSLIARPDKAAKMAASAFDFAAKNFGNNIMLKRYMALFTDGKA